MMNAMSDIDIIGSLRTHARQGDSVVRCTTTSKIDLFKTTTIMHSTLYTTFVKRLDSLFESKPILALISAEDRSITDESLLHNLVFPAIELHRSEWER
jgi:hypothetical protein